MIVSYSLNCHFASTMSIILNGALLYLVRSCRNQEIQIYNRILILTGTVDIVLSCVTAIAEPIYSQYGEYGMLVNNGAISRYLNLEYSFCMAFNFLLFYSLSVNALHFIYRFVILKRGAEAITTLRFLLMCLVAAVGPAVFVILVYQQIVSKANFNVQDANGTTRAYVAREMNDDCAHICVLVHANIKWTLTLIYIGALCTTIYGIIMVCAIQIYNFPKNHYGVLAKSQQAIDQQIFRTLLIQSSLPLVLGSLTLSVLFMAYYHGSSPIRLTSALMQPMAWLPVANPLIAILTVGVYRRRILRVYNR